MNKDKILKYCTDDSAKANGVYAIECVYDPVEGNSLYVHFDGYNNILQILQEVEYLYMTEIEEFLNTHTDSEFIYVNLSSSKFKVYYSANGKMYGINSDANGFYEEKYYNVAFDLAKIEEVVNGKVTTTYTAIEYVPMFSELHCEYGYYGYKATTGRYYAILINSNFSKFSYWITKFIYSC